MSRSRLSSNGNVHETALNRLQIRASETVDKARGPGVVEQWNRLMVKAAQAYSSIDPAESLVSIDKRRVSPFSRVTRSFTHYHYR